jgi:autophagy-related protein 2
VDGVEGQLRVKAKSEKRTTPTASRTNHDRKRKRPQPKSSGAAQSPKKSHQARRGSGFLDEDLDPAIPTAADLAESFLQTEPEEERAELEAAILSETQELGTSSILSEDGDSEIPIGTGAALSLPAFMTRFLQGIVDRLQVKIHGITISLDVDIPNETSRASASHSTDPVTVQLRVDSIDIEGVTHDLDKMTEDSSRSLPYKEGKRLICLSKIRGALISEANLFSSLARSSALSSPSAAHSDVFDDRKISTRSHLSTRGSELGTFDGPSSTDPGSSTVSRRLSSASVPRRTHETRSLSGSVVTSDSGRFDDASEEDEMSNLSESLRADAVSEVEDSEYQNSAYLDQVTESQGLEEGESESVISPSLTFAKDRPTRSSSKSPLSTPRASIHSPSSPPRDTSYFDSRTASERRSSMLQSTTIPTRQRSRFSEGRVSQSQPSLPGESVSHSSHNISHEPRMSKDTAGSSDEDGNSTPLGEQDLVESQLFSHEDAESMYMSAVSHGSSSSRIPGGWAQSSNGSDGPLSAPGSPASPRIPTEPLDNLERARLAASSMPSSPELETIARSLTSALEPLQSSIRVSPSTQAVMPNQPPPPVPESSSSVSERSTTSSHECIRLTKQVFFLDRIDVYLPAANPETPVGPAEVAYNSTIFSSTFDRQSNASRSASINVPGSFSTHLPAKQSPSAPPVTATKKAAADSQPGAKSNDSSIEVAVGQLFTQFDISVGRLILKLIYQVKEIMKQDPSGANSPELIPSSIEMDFKLNAETISLKFLERLEGTLGSAAVGSDSTQWVNPPEADVLLQTTLKGFQIDTHMSKSTTKAALTLKKFVFGYAQENIVSFDAGLQMRASVRDLKASDGIDLSANISIAQDTTRCEIVTLPMHVSIDLQRLDETFSWFGGLSSVLNLGSSIASNATITTTSPKKPKTRGVRFETPIIPDGKLLVSRNKADVRIGGFVLDLVGTECSVEVETSAVKVVSRDEGIGVSIQKIRLSGPHLKRPNEDPAINVDITATRIEYLASPKDIDLDRLLSLITPSKAKYDQDDDILLDTLLRQRKQGAVLRVTVDDFQTRVGKLDELSYLPELGEEVSRLSTVAKYLPDDDRPGLLSLIMVRKFDVFLDFNRPLGTIQLSSTDIEVAQITLPALVALSISTLSAKRNGSEELLSAATGPELREPRSRAPAVMARMIGDEMEPVVKIKLWNLKVEYRVPTLMTLLGLADNATAQDVSASLTASVVTLTDFARSTVPRRVEKSSSSSSKPMTIDVVLRDCIVGLNPLGLPAKVLVVLTEAHLMAFLPKDRNSQATADLSKASLLVIDNVAHLVSADLTSRPRRQSFDGGSTQIADLCATGFVSVSYISSAKVIVQILIAKDGERSIDVELRDDLFVLESCADSTQTLTAVLNGLTPPTPPSKEIKYRTKVIPVEDLLASLSGDAFGTAEGEYNFDDDFGLGEGSERGNGLEGDDSDDLDFDSHYYQHGLDEQYNEAIMEDQGESSTSPQLTIRDTNDGVLLDSFVEPHELAQSDELDFQEDHFGTGSMLEGTAHRWNSVKNTYDLSNASKIKKCPLKVRIRDVHIIWNLFDGYDWQHTRDTITKAVQDVESKAIEKRARNERRPTFDQDIEDEETVIGDFLFNSIYIGIPANRDPRELAAAINQELNDNVTETESIATTSLSSSPNRQGSGRRIKSKNLRLNRSKHHKITFELRGVCADLVAFPPGSGETQSSVDIRVHDFEIFDHVPTSTWRKFATYMQDAGERETGTSMIHIEILNVKPVPELAASEMVLKATVLPLRLHVDQDALDFITRFFEFKDDSAPIHASPGDVPFLQRVEVNSVKVKLDFKPKRVDYAGLRSGHTTEFMNFLILDEADMVLRHTIIYGISGFDKLGKTLNDIWMPDIKRNQLPGILAGLAPVRSLVNVGEGFRHLVVVPMREYKKDGRIVRSISKGAAAFAKTTGTELVKLGAKVAIGVQTVLQGAEGFLGSPMESPKPMEGDDSEEENKQISLYANQPVGVLQGLRGGYAGLQRDLILARDAIIAVPGEVMEGGNAAGVLRAVRKHAPTVILRPAIGVAKAGGQILMGATNSLDPANLQRADAVSYSLSVLWTQHADCSLEI